MKVFVPNQTGSDEARVAIVPATARKLVTPKLELLVEQGAGIGSSHTDEAYRAAGAQIIGPDGWAQGDVILVVQAPSAELIAQMKRGAVLIGMLAPHRNGPLFEKIAAQGVSAMAMEFLPRITRAQA